MSEVSRTCHAGQKLALQKHDMQSPAENGLAEILQIRIPTPYLVGAAAGFAGGWLARGCEWLCIGINNLLQAIVLSFNILHCSVIHWKALCHCGRSHRCRNSP